MRRSVLICLGLHFVFSQLPVSQQTDFPFAEDTASDQFLLDNSSANDIFSLTDPQQQQLQLIDDPLLASSFGMTGNDAAAAAMDDPNSLVANGKGGDACDSSSLLPGNEVEAGFGTGIQARGEACGNPNNPGANTGVGALNFGSIFTEDDERERTSTEVQDYWCWANNEAFFGYVPVCSIRLYPTLTLYEERLPSRACGFNFFVTTLKNEI